MLYGVQCKIHEELEVQSSISNVLSEIYNTIRITNKHCSIYEQLLNI